MKKNVITSDVVVAYFHCPRKAFFLLFRIDQKECHEYLRILENRAIINRNNYIQALRENNDSIGLYDHDNIKNNSAFLIEATLKSHELEAYCDVLKKVQGSSSFGRHSYEPMLVVGTHSILNEQKIKLAFVGFILGQVQNKLPVNGTIVGAENQVYNVKLEGMYKKLKSVLRILEEWTAITPSEPPPIILNKHCLYCQFHTECLEKAKMDDELSLLGRMTSKIIQKCHKKGVFTVTQLSYLFRSRRRRKRSKKLHVHFNLELQALAIRTKRIYLQDLPELHRPEVELFLDIEGIPDQDFYYLMGLLVCKNGERTYHCFWADSIQDQERIWRELVKMVEEYPEAPVYHYGSYESRAVEDLGGKYYLDCKAFKERLVNVTQFIYAKVYFPVFSNGLKEIGGFLGATWSSPEASSLQTLVWRYRWEESGDDNYKKILTTYNEEDCRALLLLTDKLSEIGRAADSLDIVDFADHPKQWSTLKGNEIHGELKDILLFAHGNYSKNRISFRSQNNRNEIGKRKLGAVKGHLGYKRVPTFGGRVIHVRMRKKCPKCKQLLQKSDLLAEHAVIDLRFTKNGSRKTVTRYVGAKGFCKRCNEYNNPPIISRGNRQIFGHNFQAWIIYQRIFLRLPHRIIVQVMEDIFGVKTTAATVVNIINNFSSYYVDTEKMLVQRILQSPFIHVDETKISIRGFNQYVWVFTDGEHVVYKLTETRETDIVRDFLSNYDGVLVSDFYPGFDSITCRQQKCLVHLIRDLNDDLWDSPFNTEFESFVFEVKNLLVPIIEAVEIYGLKKRHLNKFMESVDRFYKRIIVDVEYKSELTLKYQKRFLRYGDSLFRFLEEDGIPWNNNMAERAIRHLAIQRNISGWFSENGAHQYLRLLAISQTCRFQEKSFLKFLLSKEKDIDKFKQPKPKKIGLVCRSPKAGGMPEISNGISA